MVEIIRKRSGPVLELRDFIADRKWTTAKARANPHQYTVRNKHPDEEAFEDAVRLIRENGYKKMFWRKAYICFDCDGMRYWTMGWPPEETTIINRANNDR